MTDRDNLLPHWTWEDLEAGGPGSAPRGPRAPGREHLMRGLAEDARRATPRELLQQVLSAGWVMAQMGARQGGSATDLPHVAGASAS